MNPDSGIGHGKFGRRSDASVQELAFEAYRDAMKDAGITSDEIDLGADPLRGVQLARGRRERRQVLLPVRPALKWKPPRLPQSIEQIRNGSLDGSVPGAAAEMARQEMLDRYGIAAYSDGYHVYTTISSALQQTARG